MNTTSTGRCSVQPARRIGLAMSENLLDAGGTAEDRLLAEAFRAKGFAVQPIAWTTNSEVDGIDAVLLRSCWDYHLWPDDFHSWLDHLGRLGLEVWNPIELVRWNMDKRYLFDLARRDVAIVPSLLCEQLDRRDLDSLFQRLGSDEIVLKPTIGATAHGCVKLSRSATDFVIPAEVEGPWLVQPFMTEIAVDGEWSLLYFGGQLGHSVLKQPASGEYRVQSDWGGTATRRDPSEDLIELANQTLAALDVTPLYARVDMVRTSTGPLLMELELIEPQLFLEAGDPALDALVEAFVDR